MILISLFINERDIYLKIHPIKSNWVKTEHYSGTSNLFCRQRLTFMYVFSYPNDLGSMQDRKN